MKVRIACQWSGCREVGTAHHPFVHEELFAASPFMVHMQDCLSGILSRTLLPLGDIWVNGSLTSSKHMARMAIRLPDS